MKLSGTSLHRYSNSVALTVNSSASREVVDGARGSERDTACFYFRVFHSCTELKQQTIWYIKTRQGLSITCLCDAFCTSFFFVFVFSIKTNKGMKRCECKSRYAWQKVVSANVYIMLLVTLTMKERWKAAKCHRRGILTEVTYFGPRPFLGAHNDLTHSVTFTPSSRPSPVTTLTSADLLWPK